MTIYGSEKQKILSKKPPKTSIVKKQVHSWPWVKSDFCHTILNQKIMTEYSES